MLAMKLRAQQARWDHLAREDPFWAILSDPGKRHGKWDPDQFFASGREEIAAAMRYAETLGLPAARARALDFGCGVGRLTQALAGWFNSVTGVDISAVMIGLARQYNRVGERCVYAHNAAADLRPFADHSFDFIYSRIVLQHMAPRQARGYVREFVRVLRPSGLALFQLPSRLRSPSAWSRLGYRMRHFLRRVVLRDPNLLEMYGVPHKVLLDDLRQCGARLADAHRDESADEEWESWRYAVTK